MAGWNGSREVVNWQRQERQKTKSQRLFGLYLSVCTLHEEAKAKEREASEPCCKRGDTARAHQRLIFVSILDYDCSAARVHRQQSLRREHTHHRHCCTERSRSRFTTFIRDDYYLLDRHALLPRHHAASLTSTTRWICPIPPNRPPSLRHQNTRPLCVCNISSDALCLRPTSIKVGSNSPDPLGSPCCDDTKC